MTFISWFNELYPNGTISTSRLDPRSDPLFCNCFQWDCHPGDDTRNKCINMKFYSTLEFNQFNQSHDQGSLIGLFQHSRKIYAGNFYRTGSRFGNELEQPKACTFKGEGCILIPWKTSHHLNSLSSNFLDFISSPTRLARDSQSHINLFIGSWFSSKPKATSNPQSSYPKQTWSPSSSSGNSQSNYPKQTQTHSSSSSNSQANYPKQTWTSQSGNQQGYKSLPSAPWQQAEVFGLIGLNPRGADLLCALWIPCYKTLRILLTTKTSP